MKINIILLVFINLSICSVAQISTKINLDKNTYANTFSVSLNYHLSKMSIVETGVNFNLNSRKDFIANYVYNLYPKNFKQSIGVDLNYKMNLFHLTNGGGYLYIIQRNKLNRLTAISESSLVEISAANNYIPMYSTDVLLISNLMVYRHGIGLGFSAIINDRINIEGDMSFSAMWIDYKQSYFKPNSAGSLELFWCNTMNLGLSYTIKKSSSTKN